MCAYTLQRHIFLFLGPYCSLIPKPIIGICQHVGLTARISFMLRSVRASSLICLSQTLKFLQASGYPGATA
jgi:hypothetical protein